MNPQFRPSAQRGQAMIEYAVIAAVLVSAMFLVSFDGKSVAQLLADMVRAFFRDLSHFISLP